MVVYHELIGLHFESELLELFKGSLFLAILYQAKIDFGQLGNEIVFVCLDQVDPDVSNLWLDNVRLVLVFNCNW